MVHVASSGGRHKMLAFASTESPLDTIITVNTKEIGLATSSSSPSPSSSNSSEPAIISTDIQRDLHIIAEEPTAPISPRIHKNPFNDSYNGTSKRGKMNRNQDGNNGNANFLADTFNSNNQNMNVTTTMGDEGLQLISHGLTDSICESLKLLDNDNENSNNSPSLQFQQQQRQQQNPAAAMFTDEIVITTTTTIKKTNKTGIMKAPGSGQKTPTIRINKTEGWQKHSTFPEEGSLSNDSEETPLLLDDETASASADLLLTSTDTDKRLGKVSNEVSTNPPPVTGTFSGTPNIQATHKLGKVTNGAKQTVLKRVSFGSSKGSMVETLVYENPIPEEPDKKTVAEVPGGPGQSSEDGDPSQDSAGGSTGGSRPPSRVRVTFFESEKPLAVSSPESDIIDFDLSNMTLPGSPTAAEHTPTYNRQMSEGWDNPFRPDGDLSKEADQIVELIKEGKPINEETLRSKSPSVTDSFIVSHHNQLNASPKGKEVNGTTANGSGGPDTVQHGVVTPAAQASQVEHVVLKKKKGCCVIQ